MDKNGKKIDFDGFLMDSTVLPKHCYKIFQQMKTTKKDMESPISDMEKRLILKKIDLNPSKIDLNR